ncbi:hypothetical protein [Planctomicrobium sp. SH664]|uniref:hypothetical protein n=1 Tax=Planctomicrobium sp. SH664 TaxID=3448125 RepID=UPI003F5B47CA
MMTDSTNYDRLNDLLVDIHRSLLRYVAEAWTWSQVEDQGLEDLVHRLAAGQEDNVRRLAELLMSRRQRIDFGMYPLAFTSLHYVAIEYLLQELVASQTAIVRQLEDSLISFQSDPQALAVLRQVVDSERAALNELRAATSSAVGTWMK